MHKNSVPGVAQILSSSMEEMHFTSKDSVVWPVIILISGKCLITALYTFNTGLNCGLLRAALLSYFVGCPAIVEANLTVSKITGLDRHQKSSQITLQSAIWSMTQLTFTRKGVY
jgi:hypothetical protein